METVEYEIQDGIAQIHLNRPHRLNAMVPELVEDLCQALDCATDDDARVAILGGRGRAFSAGHDLKEESLGLSEIQDRRHLQRIQDVTRKIRRAPFPIIAKVRGYALGGGCEFALLCDLIVADSSAVFGFPEVAVGLSVTGGISQVLPLVVGMVRAKELLMLGEFIPSDEALAMGLINRVVKPEDLEAAVLSIARQLIERPRLALSLAKSNLDKGPGMDLESVLDWEVQQALSAHRSSESRDQAKAFQARHPGKP